MPPGVFQSWAIFCLLLSSPPPAMLEEVGTPSNLLGPKNFNHHPFEAGQYLKETLQAAEPTKQGPVVFPNDAPPPPRPPLIVTSRPLLESVARSELNPNPPQSPTQPPNQEAVENYNTIAEPSQLSRVNFRPGFLARTKEYKPFTYNLPKNYVTPHDNYVTINDNYVTPNPVGSTAVVLVNAVTGKPVNGYGDYDDYEGGFGKSTYADVVKKNRLLNGGFGRDNHYDDYEEKTVLPPIYKALADYAKQNVLRVKQKNEETKHRYLKIKEPAYSNTYQNNQLDENDKDYSQNSNYAFSYIVKDKDTGDDFSHSQQSSGSATNGEYRVRLPDGRMQIVSYTADENGYKADVRYDDEDKTAGNSIDNRNHQTQNNHVGNNHRYQNHNQYNPRNNYNYQSQNQYVAPSNNQNHKYQNQNYVLSPENYVTPTKKVYVNHNHANPNNNVDYVEINKELYNQQRNVNERIVQQKKYQKGGVKEDYYNQYGEVSNEYENNDYSSEFNGKNDNNYQQHQSKFTQLAENKVNPQGNVGVIVVQNNLDEINPKPTLKPSYEELRNLFLHKQPIAASQNYLYNNIPIELNVPSTTPRPNTYETTTEHVVIIGTTKPNLYTNIKSSIPTASPTSIYQGLSTPSSFTVTPKNIDFSGPKPVLTSSFIDRINRYLSF